MSHQPFENWLLEDEELTDQENLALKKHLHDCSSCSELAESWHSAQALLLHTPPVEPAAGFTLRWQESLAERKALKQKLLVRRLMLGLILAASATLVLFLTYVVVNTNVIDLVTGITGLFTNSASAFVQFRAGLLSWITNPALLPIWIFLACGLCMLCAVWLLTLWRITAQGVERNELS